MNPLRLILIIALLLFASAFPAQMQAEEAKKPALRAGAATSVITPPLGEPIVGGFTPFPS